MCARMHTRVCKHRCWRQWKMTVHITIIVTDIPQFLLTLAVLMFTRLKKKFYIFMFIIFFFGHCCTHSLFIWDRCCSSVQSEWTQLTCSCIVTSVWIRYEYCVNGNTKSILVCLPLTHPSSLHRLNPSHYVFITLYLIFDVICTVLCFP